MKTHASHRQPKILLVEDHPFQLIGLHMQLNLLGFFRVSTALDKAEALALIDRGLSFDLLLCDQHLPDGYGLDLIDSAHQLGAIRYAMLISGIDESPLRQHLLHNAHERDLPLLACLSKPLPVERFQQALAPIWDSL